MNISLTNKEPQRVDCDVLVMGIFTNIQYNTSTKKINDLLTNTIIIMSADEKFNGELGQSMMINSINSKIRADRVLIVGLGKKSKFNSATAREVGVIIANKTKHFSKTIGIYLDTITQSSQIQAFAEGVRLGTYSFNKYKSKENKQSTIDSIVFISKQIKNKKFIEDNNIAVKANTISDSVVFTRDLVNEPPVTLTPTKLAQLAEEIAAEGGLKCTVFDEHEIKKRKMGGLLGVSLGSSEPPRFIHLEYTPHRKTKKSVAIVGKGITFDSGGLCLKPPDGMKTMKMDMAGSAVVLGVMKAVSKLKPAVHVHGLISATENMTGASAYKPDDVVTALNGKTIEIINTDAEGRVVLSDALSYAVKLKVQEIVDLATLTGACIVGLGSYTAGVMGNNQALIDKILNASRNAGEKMWQLPMDDELRKEMESDIADVKNAGSRWGGAITAAIFLEHFVGNTPWAHIDIAGPAFMDSATRSQPKGGTGFGVRTILSYLGSK